MYIKREELRSIEMLIVVFLSIAQALKFKLQSRPVTALVEFFINTIDLMMAWVPRGYSLYSVNYDDILAFLKATGRAGTKKEKNKNKTKKEKNKEKKIKNKKNLKKYKNKVDISRNQLRERNSLLIAKKNKLKSLVKSREDVKYSKDKTLKFKLSSQIHKLRNNIKRSEKKTDNLRKSISVEQNKLAKNQTRGLKSQFVRTKRRKEKVISDLEEVRHRWAKISPEVTRLMSVEKEIRGDILSLKKEVSKENFIEKKSTNI